MHHSFHPACLFFPRLPEDDLRALAEDIRENGLLNPIVTLDGKILDGRNRLAACEIAGVEARFVEWSGDGSPLAWVISTNMVRRHLNASQRAVVAFELLPMLEAEAKQRQQLSRGRGIKGANQLATFSASGKASQVAARYAKANSAYIEKLKRINKKAPEIIDEVKSGRVSINEASRLAKVSAAQREIILTSARAQADQPFKRVMRRVLAEHRLESAEYVRPNDSQVEIWCGDCIQLMRDRIADESISVVTTSPPFNHSILYRTYDDDLDESDYLNWMAEVFAEIKRVLKPDGSLFLVVGHSPSKPWTAMRLAEIAGRSLQLQNQIIWTKALTVDNQSHGHFRPITGQRYLNRSWESVFHFTKTGTAPLDRLAVGVPYEFEYNSGRTGNSVRCGGDVWFIPHETVHGSEDRGKHPATFPAELAERCIRLAGIKSNTVVLDPFCGVNGMIASARLGVQGIGIDCDPVYCDEAMWRVRQNQISNTTLNQFEVVGS